MTNEVRLHVSSEERLEEDPGRAAAKGELLHHSRPQVKSELASLRSSTASSEVNLHAGLGVVEHHSFAQELVNAFLQTLLSQAPDLASIQQPL